MNSNVETTPKLYYIPPSDEHFELLKEKVIEFWNEIGDNKDYIKEKVDRIKNVKNIADNFMFLVVGFDFYNQHLLASRLPEEVRKELRERMISAGHNSLYIPF